MNDSESGDLATGSTNTATDDIGDSDVGSLFAWSGDGTDLGSVGYSLDAGDDVQDSFSGATSGPGSTTTGSPTPTPLTIPTGHNVVQLIDRDDMGWLDWTLADRQNYINDHPKLNLTLTSPNPVMTGGALWAALKDTPDALNITTPSFDQAKNMLLLACDCFGNPDVLVIGDHGNTYGQTVHNTFIGPGDTSRDFSNTETIVGSVAPGGTLILAGCSVLSTVDTIEFWQAEADLHSIDIIGSTTEVTWPNGTPTGTWITLYHNP